MEVAGNQPFPVSDEEQATWADSVLKWTIIICATVSMLVMIVGICVSTYQKIRFMYRYKSLWPVNCWFCNISSKVAYSVKNSWTCPSCKQYNGFTKDGGYNKTISAQYIQALNPPVVARGLTQTPLTDKKSGTGGNGLCEECNLNQELKVFHLSSFVPTSDANFDKEIEIERNNLEELYHLCSLCEKILEEKLANGVNYVDKQKNGKSKSKQNTEIENELKIRRSKNRIRDVLALLEKPGQTSANEFEKNSNSSKDSHGTFYSTASSISEKGTYERSSEGMDVSEDEFDEVTSLDRLSIGNPRRTPITSSQFLPSTSTCSNCTSMPHFPSAMGKTVPSSSSVWNDYPLAYNNGLNFGGAMPGVPELTTPSITSYGSCVGPHQSTSFCHNYPQIQSNFYRSSSVANIFGGKSLLSPSRLSFGSASNLSLNNFGASNSWGVGLYYHNCFGPIPSPTMYSYSHFGASAHPNSHHISRASSQSSGFVSQQGIQTPPPMRSPEGSRSPSVFSMKDNNSSFDGRANSETYLHFRDTKKAETRTLNARSNEWSRFGPSMLSKSSRAGTTLRRSPRIAKLKPTTPDKSCYYSSDSDEDAVDKTREKNPKREKFTRPKTPTRKEEPEPSISPVGQKAKKLFYFASLLFNVLFLLWLIFGDGDQHQILRNRFNDLKFTSLIELWRDSFEWMCDVSNIVIVKLANWYGEIEILLISN